MSKARYSDMGARRLDLGDCERYARVYGLSGGELRSLAFAVEALEDVFMADRAQQQQMRADLAGQASRNG